MTEQRACLHCDAPDGALVRRSKVNLRQWIVAKPTEVESLYMRAPERVELKRMGLCGSCFERVES